jgi:acetyl esterase/lipase
MDAADGGPFAMTRRSLLLALAAPPKIEEDIVYDGDLRLDIAAPTGLRSPVILGLHGGGWSMGSRRSFHRVMPGFVEAGYAVATMQYRLAPGAKFPAQLDDVRKAMDFLRKNAARWNLDAERMVLMGASAGAQIALLAGFADPHVRAVIDLSGPTDLRDWRMGGNAEENLKKTTGKNSVNLIEEYLGGPPVTETAIRAASPLLQVKRGGPPVFVLHWKEDQAVDAEQARRLVAELAAKGVPHEVHWFEGRGHAFAGKGVEEIVPRSVEFLKRHLR